MTNPNSKLAAEARKMMQGKKGAKEDEAKPGFLASRMESLKEINTGKRMQKVLYNVDPERCRMWEHHNRQYSMLNEQRCADLIDGFKAMGRQEFPAIVRRVEGDPDHDYEVICGARRHWTAKYLGWRLLVEVRELTDEEAFRLSDIENRDREDISDYERALDYQKALNLYYTSMQQMADRLEVSKSWLSRFLDLAELPEEIVKAYRDITEIKVTHVRHIKPILKSSNKRKLVLRRAVELQGMGLEGSAVVKELLKAGEDRRKKTEKAKILKKYTLDDGRVYVEIKRSGRKYQILVDAASGVTKEEVKDALKEFVEDILSENR